MRDRSGIAEGEQVRRWALSAQGVVQGVGFRPFVYRAAVSRGLVGWVRNAADRVQIEVQGRTGDLEGFVAALRTELPQPGHVSRLDVREVERRPEDAFRIIASDEAAVPRPVIPADLATCAECLREVETAGERRHRYPFTNCTYCGPRYSIIEGLPYDRPRTSMKRFKMCAGCRAEYEEPQDRRFHAQPIACPKCGPQLELLSPNGRRLAEREQALALAVDALKQGKVVALKGLGGFQLLADATNDEAVRILRQRKRREEKPLALMYPSVAVVRDHCNVSAEEERVLTSPQAPILLLRRLAERGPGGPPAVAESVAPGNPRLGVMLPYTPLHHLLLANVDRPIVCTSGNMSEEPMCISTEEALPRLGSVADLFLTHDRPVVRQVDDSVARVDGEGLQVIRRARGFAPLPVDLGFDGPTILAVGGHLKNAVALRMGAQVVLSQHIGDLDSADGRDLFERTIQDLLAFFGARPELIACDLHPDYASTRHAERLAAEWDVPLFRVQHHHAHVASTMAEHGLTGELLGISWDGTGYGPDGTVWGGEVLSCDECDYRRVAHLRPFRLPGGERAVREPRRSALGVLYELVGDGAAQLARQWFSHAEIKTLLTMLARGLNSPVTASVGRLFDAVAAIVGLRERVGFEGQAAMELEFATEGVEEDAAYRLPVLPGEPAVADWEPLVRALLDDLNQGVPVGVMSARFHNALIEFAVESAKRVGLSRVALSGGCFQNLYLAERIRARLRAAGFEVYTQRRVPPNDGGIALGQVLTAARMWEKRGASE